VDELATGEAVEQSGNLSQTGRRGLKQYDKYSSGADLEYLFED
jgi:hypothetical protein